MLRLVCWLISNLCRCSGLLKCLCVWCSLVCLGRARSMRFNGVGCIGMWYSVLLFVLALWLLRLTFKISFALCFGVCHVVCYNGRSHMVLVCRCLKDPDIIFCFDLFVCLLVLVMPFWKWLLCSQCWFQRWYYDCCGYDGYVVVHDNAFVAVLHAFLCHVSLPRPVKMVCLQIFVLWWRFCLFAGAVCFSHSMFLVVSRLVFVAMYMLLALPRMFKWWGFRDEVCFWLCVTRLLVAILHTTFVLWRQCLTCPACFV